MELAEMEVLWKDMSQQLEQQQSLNKKIIMQMTQQRFNNKISAIGKFEGIGSIICIVTAIVILFNLHKMDTPWLMVASGICIAFLVLGPYFTLSAYRDMRRIDIQSQNHQAVIQSFIKSRKRFLKTQKILLFSMVFFMVSILPVFNRIGQSPGDAPFNTSNYIWVLGLLFIIPFSLWGYRSYSRMTAGAERILRELGE